MTRIAFGIVANVLMIMCQYSSSAALAQYSTKTVESAFQGYYVIIRKQTNGGVCKASNWTSQDTLPAIEMQPAPQMHVSSNEVLYYHGGVRCEILGVRRRKPTIFVAGAGADSNLAIDVDLRCFDEGTVGRHTMTWRLMNLDQDEVLIEARSGRAPEAWVKCRGK